MIANKKKQELLDNRAETLDLMKRLLEKIQGVTDGTLREQMLEDLKILGKISIEENQLIDKLN